MTTSYRFRAKRVFGQNERYTRPQRTVNPAKTKTVLNPYFYRFIVESCLTLHESLNLAVPSIQFNRSMISSMNK
jgi:hypothetical protein